MLNLAAIVLFSVAAVLAAGSITLQVLAAMPKLAALRHADLTAPALRQVRFSISEVVVNTDGKVVSLPVKLARPALQARSLSAAA